MNYCSWSDGRESSDVYVYASVEGWVIHVRASRPVNDTPMPELPRAPQPGEDQSAWLAAHAARRAWLDSATRRAIGLPSDGECLVEPDRRACIARLEHLASIGYLVPANALEALRTEVSAIDTPAVASGQLES